ASACVRMHFCSAMRADTSGRLRHYLDAAPADIKIELKQKASCFDFSNQLSFLTCFQKNSSKTTLPDSRLRTRDSRLFYSIFA
ncbi:hypothetical protein, partial [Rufibacter roseus]